MEKEKETKTVSLLDLQAKVLKLEREGAKIKSQIMNLNKQLDEFRGKLVEKKEKKKTKAPASDQVKGLLAALAEAKKKGDKKAGASIRRQLRAAGYSLRNKK